MQFVLNILTILAFVMSLATWITEAVRRKRKVSLTIFDYRYWPVHSVVQFFMTIQNDSSIPICITAISLECDGKLFACELEPKRIKGSDENPVKTPTFPINISPRQGMGCYLEFVYAPNIPLADGKKVDFLIDSNRGELRKSVFLGPEGYYLHTRY